MRIATWNLEHAAGKAKNDLRLHRLHAMDCDIWLLTETHDDIDLGSSYAPLHPTERFPGGPGERWTALWSRYPILHTARVSDPSRTVAAVLSTPRGPLLVFGTVLPWHTDPGPTGKALSWSEHHRVLPEQAKEWAALQREHGVPMCVAGDFNTSLGAKHYYGTKRGRQLLRAGLDSAGLICVTETERIPSGLLRDPPIDHIALSHELAATSGVSCAWEGTDTNGTRLSDHSGLAVDIR